MQHTFTIENFCVRLRPVRLADAAFIVWLRNLEHAKGHIGDSAQDIASQQKWLKAYFKRDGDYYFIIETICGTPLGTYGIYKIQGDHGESGRWIVRPDAPAALPSIVLGFEIAFGRLGFSKIEAHTVSSNYRVLSLNRKLGLKMTGIAPTAQVIDGKSVQLILFELQSQDWLNLRESILPLARLAGDKLRSWEQLSASDTMDF